METETDVEADEKARFAKVCLEKWELLEIQRMVIRNTLGEEIACDYLEKWVRNPESVNNVVTWKLIEGFLNNYLSGAKELMKKVAAKEQSNDGK